MSTDIPFFPKASSWLEGSVLRGEPRLDAELRALGRERDPEMRANGLLNLAGRMALAGKSEGSLKILGLLEDFLSKDNSPWIPSLQAKAGKLRQTILGQANPLAGAELYLNRFHQAATEPSALLAFGVGALAGGVIRQVVAGGLLRASSAWWTRGLTARVLAGTAALAVEAPVIARIQGGGGVEWRENFLLLGAMRLAGTVGRALCPPSGMAGTRPALQGMVTQGAMLGGLFLGGKILGKEDHDSLLGSLEILLLSQIGSRISQRLLGDPLGLRFRSFGDTSKPDAGWRKNLIHFPTPAPVGRRVQPLRGSEAKPTPLPIAMSTGRESGGGGNFIRRRLEQRIRHELGPRLLISPESLDLIVQAFNQTQFSVEPERMLRRYAELLLKVQVDHAMTLDRPMMKEEILERAVQAFAFVTRLDPLRLGSGSLYEHLLHYGLEEFLLREDQAAFNEWVRLAGLNRTVEGLEAFLGTNARHIPPTVWQGPAGRAWGKRLASLPLSPAAQAAAHAYLATLPERMPFLDHAENHLPWDQFTILRSLELFLGMSGLDAPQAQSFFQSLEKAAASPAARPRLERIFKLVVLDLLPEKFRETVSWGSFDLDGLRGDGTLDPLASQFRPAAHRLNGTIYTAFLDDIPLAEKIARIYSLAHIYSPEEVFKRHRNEHTYRAHELLLLREKSLRRRGKDAALAGFTEEDVLEMLFLNPTEFATEAREAILRRGEVELKVMSALAMEKLWTSLNHPNRNDPAPLSFYVDASRDPSGKPLIALREQNPRWPREEKIRQAIQLSGGVVHEYEHHLHHRELDYNTLEGMMRAEMRARAEEIFYHLRQGNFPEWERMLELSPYGLGIYLRNWVEQDYPRGHHLIVVPRQ